MVGVTVDNDLTIKEDIVSTEIPIGNSYALLRMGERPSGLRRHY